MAHKPLIGGTVYEVQGGKALIGGTGYDIQKGRGFVGGTGYDMSLKKYPTKGLVHEFLFNNDYGCSVTGLQPSYPRNIGLGTLAGKQCLLLNTSAADQYASAQYNGIAKLNKFSVSYWLYPQNLGSFETNNITLSDIRHLHGVQTGITTQKNTFANGISRARLELAGSSEPMGVMNNIVGVNGGVIGLWNAWYHVVITLGDNGLRIYVNGALKETAAGYTEVNEEYAPNNLDYVVTDRILSISSHIAWEHNPNPNGLCNLRIYNRELEPEEIGKLYNNGQGI